MSSKQILTGYDREVCEWVYQKTGGVYGPGCTGIGLMDVNTRRLVAGVAYDGFNGSQVLMHVRIEHRHALTRKYLWFCFYYPFEQLKVRRVTGLVAKTNRAARKLDEHLGFVQETVLKHAAPDGGDMLVYRMYQDQCRFLNWNPHGQTSNSRGNSQRVA